MTSHPSGGGDQWWKSSRSPYQFHVLMVSSFMIDAYFLDASFLTRYCHFSDPSLHKCLTTTWWFPLEIQYGIVLTVIGWRFDEWLQGQCKLPPFPPESAIRVFRKSCQRLPQPIVSASLMSCQFSCGWRNDFADLGKYKGKQLLPIVMHTITPNRLQVDHFYF